VDGYLYGSARPRASASGCLAARSHSGHNGLPRAFQDAGNLAGHGSSEEEISALRIAVRQAHTNNVSIPLVRGGPRMPERLRAQTSRRRNGTSGSERRGH
jgi:hypothetical protein